jgi:hypothetical protein
MNFGNYAILDTVTHYFEKEPDWFWKIKPVHSGLELERSKFLLHNRVIETADGVRRELPPTWLEIAYREIALTFGGTNIPVSDEDDTPVLAEDASIQEIEKFLAEAPQGLVMEIWKALGAAYPKWGPADPNAV